MRRALFNLSNPRLLKVQKVKSPPQGTQARVQVLSRRKRWILPFAVVVLYKTLYSVSFRPEGSSNTHKKRARASMKVSNIVACEVKLLREAPR